MVDFAPQASNSAGASRGPVAGIISDVSLSPSISSTDFILLRALQTMHENVENACSAFIANPSKLTFGAMLEPVTLFRAELWSRIFLAESVFAASLGARRATDFADFSKIVHGMAEISNLYFFLLNPADRLGMHPMLPLTRTIARKIDRSPLLAVEYVVDGTTARVQLREKLDVLISLAQRGEAEKSRAKLFD